MAYNLLGSRVTYWVGSGGSSTSGPDIRGTGKTYYDQTAEDLANNRSRIKVEYGDVVNSGLYTSYTLTVRIQKKVGSNWENVQTKTYNQSSGNISAGTHIRGNLADVFIPHDSTGSAQVRTYITITDTGAFDSSQSFMYIYDLPQISQQTQANPLTLTVGQSTLYEVNPMSSNYSHSFMIEFGNLTKYVGAGGVLVDTETIAYGSPTIICPTTFYDEFTTSSATGTITIKTYNGSNRVGQDSSNTLTVLAGDACKPTITGTVTDTNVATTALTGSSSIIVPYYSQVRVTPSIQISAIADTSTTLVSKSVDGNIFTTSYYEPTTIKKDYEVTAINSRNLSNTVTLSANSILDYTKPTVNASSKFNRTSPTADNMYVSFSGTFWNKNFGAASNTLTVKWYVKEKSSSTYTLGGTFTQGTDYTVSGNNYSATNKQLTCPLTGGWSYNKAYDFKIEATDRLGSEILVTSVNKGKPIFYWYEKNNTNYFKVNGTILADTFSGLLNAIYPVGSIYMSVNATSPATLFGGTWSQLKNAYLFATNDTSGTKGNITGSGKDSGSTTLTANQIPAHKHTTWHRDPNASSYPAKEYMVDSGGTGESFAGWGASFSAKTANIMETGNTGGSQGHTHTIANIEVYVWQRTA